MATATGSGTGNRDARRRRIVDGGSDRFALITGRIQTLPTPLASSPTDGSSPLSGSDEPLPHLGPLHGEEKLSETFLAKLVPDFEVPESSLPKHDSYSEFPAEGTSGDSCFRGRKVRPKHETPFTSRSTSPRSEGNVHSPNLPAKLLKLINPNQLRSAIAASTDTRLLCAVAGGLLVVLSSIGFPILGWWFIRVIVTFRPLYLILIANLTIVASHIISQKQSGHDRTAKEDLSKLSNDESGWADQVGTSLEFGFLLMNVLDAIVMDCTLYAVVVVCGLTFFGKFVR